VLLPRLEIAGEIVFKVRVVALQPVLANLIGTRMEVRMTIPARLPLPRPTLRASWLPNVRACVSRPESGSFAAMPGRRSTPHDRESVGLVTVIVLGFIQNGGSLASPTA
jgi:hypothetical protein